MPLRSGGLLVWVKTPSLMLTKYFAYLIPDTGHPLIGLDYFLGCLPLLPDRKQFEGKDAYSCVSLKFIQNNSRLFLLLEHAACRWPERKA